METPVSTPRGRERGFSIIEALIAAAILLIIALGLLPMFTQSMRDNVAGRDATQATNGSRTQLENLLQLPFNNAQLVVPNGSTQLTSTDAYTKGTGGDGNADEGWWTNPAGKGSVLWTRDTTVRQYSVSDLSDGDLDTPLDGNTQPTFVQLKEITVRMNNPKLVFHQDADGNNVLDSGGLLGNGQGIVLRIVKPF